MLAMSIWKTLAQVNPGKASEGLWKTPVKEATGAGELHIALSCLYFPQKSLVVLDIWGGICWMLLTEQT